MKVRFRQFMTTTLTLLVLIVVSGALYVRVAPLDPALHAADTRHGLGDWPGPGRFEAVRPLSRPGDEVLDALHAIALDTPRTRLFEGDPADGHVSYVTRSALWGFPDITNAWVESGRLHIRGHLVYGRSDLGVNRARIEGWLARLGPL